jgi:tRNA(Leu) C34 or U34 (ribose-2'-O)-methylase TrmL
MSLPILLAQLKVAEFRTLAAVAGDGASMQNAQPPVPQSIHQYSSPDSTMQAEIARQSIAPQMSHAQRILAPWEVDWCQSVALLVGNEGNGLPEEIERAADARIRIPISSGIESLNAAAAAAVLFYEAARQRNSQPPVNIKT